jgi:hypothetical protein
LIAAREVGHH